MIEYWIIAVRGTQPLLWIVLFGGNKTIPFNCLYKKLDLKYSLPTATAVFCLGHLCFEYFNLHDCMLLDDYILYL